MNKPVPNALQRAALLLLILFLCQGFQAYAQAAAATPPAPNTQPATAADYERLSFMETNNAQAAANSSGTAGLLLRTLGALLLIVGLIVLAGWGLRRFGAGLLGNGATSEGPEVAVLSQTPLGNNRSLTVVRFGDQALLLGATATSFTLLAAEPLQNAARNPPARSVAELLAQDGAGNFNDELTLAQGRWQANVLAGESA